MSNKNIEAIERNNYWASLTPQQQLKSLDTRLGEGVGAKKQRIKIQAKINNPQVEVQRKAKKKKRGKNV
tara:strand:- start:2960 stop:3166 length:207 start_codon:yes stop_codon:yes gene_type:complete